MKKLLFAAFIVLAMIFVVSCSEDEISDALGGSCQNEGAETCSADSSQILICQNFSWQAKKDCNLNFGQYCRQTASGSYSCTDSGNSTTDPTNPTNDDTTDPTEPESNDNDQPTDTEPADNDQTTDTEPVDDTDTETENDDDTDTEQADTEPVVKDLETCRDIFQCQKNCDSIECNNECYNRGVVEAQNDFYERNQKCPTYTEIDDLRRCQQLYIKCGIPGDESYGAPYGHAVITGSFPHIHEAGTTSFSSGTFTGTVVNGNFGSNGNIPDPTSDDSFSVAFLNQAGDSIILRQTYNSTGKTPDVFFVIDAHSPGTYSVGLNNKDNVQMIVSENVENEADACDHAFGYGFVEISGTGLTETYSAGAYTINIQGEVNLYSFKNAPMYVGPSNTGDITNENLVACEPK
ncbi:hypothetical protein IKS86_00495 [bacterium]|nr:hypothetical protein [bacterium]